MRSVAIFAHNEEAAIGGAIEAVRAAGLAADDRVVVLVNGATDGTLAAARVAAGADPRVQITDIRLGDKANAWTLYVRRLADPAADVHVFVDSDVRISPGSLALIDSALAAHPEASAAAGLPRGGRQAPAWAVRILENHGLPGNFYALRGALVRRMRGCLWLPVGLIGDDTLLRWLILRDLDPQAAPRLERIRPVPGAYFDYASFSRVSVTGIRRLWRRHLRYALREVQARTLWRRLEAEGLAAMPHRIDALYAEARPWREMRASPGPVPLRRLLFPLVLARARRGAGAPLAAPSWRETAPEPAPAAAGS